MARRPPDITREAWLELIRLRQSLNLKEDEEVKSLIVYKAAQYLNS